MAARSSREPDLTIADPERQTLNPIVLEQIGQTLVGQPALAGRELCRCLGSVVSVVLGGLKKEGYGGD